MSKYIDADKLLNDLAVANCFHCKRNDIKCKKCGIGECIEWLKNSEAEDVIPIDVVARNIEYKFTSLECGYELCDECNDMDCLESIESMVRGWKNGNE